MKPVTIAVAALVTFFFLSVKSQAQMDTTA